jgi:hypothetical protein
MQSLARRLWSCPECGRGWVGEGQPLQILGVRGRLPDDPHGTELVCLNCRCAVNAVGKPLGFAKR